MPLWELLQIKKNDRVAQVSGSPTYPSLNPQRRDKDRDKKARWPHPGSSEWAVIPGGASLCILGRYVPSS
jgi:hypothetical protein